MRRAALGVGLVLGGLGGSPVHADTPHADSPRSDSPAPARADAPADSPTTVTAEAGAEADSNVQRVDTGPGLMTTRVGAAVGRLGAKVDHRGKAFGGAYVLALSSLARMVGDRDPDVATENVLLIGGDVKFLHAVGKRPVSAGIGMTAFDALPISDPTGARTFINFGADGLLVLRGGEDRTLTIAIGGRAFSYKPDHHFDWVGPAANARLDLMLWQQAGGTRSLELATYAGVEARSYNSTALASACSDEMPPEDPRTCFAGTSLPRRDRYQRAGLELTYVGSIVAAASYQLTVIDSNSFGQSLVRHRVILSATTDLPWKLFGTALATLQYDQYLDGLIVEKDLQNQTFTTLDDENRSSLQLRLARPVTDAWSVETRGALWRDLGYATDNTIFRRALLYFGVIYSK
jgi:hypothetical protein